MTVLEAVSQSCRDARLLHMQRADPCDYQYRSFLKTQFLEAAYVFSLAIFDHAPEAPEMAVPGMMPYTLLDLAACVKGEVSALSDISNASYAQVWDTNSPILTTATSPRLAASSSVATAAASAEANAGMPTGTKTLRSSRQRR